MAKVSKTKTKSAVADYRARIAQVNSLIKQVRAVLPDLVLMSDDQRQHSAGRLRTGETEVLRSILDVVDHDPAPYAILANEDEGHDPNAFETALLRERLDERDALASVFDTIAKLALEVGDTVLTLGASARPAILAAYEIAKPRAVRDLATRKGLASAQTFYGAGVRKQIRKKKQAAKKSK